MASKFSNDYESSPRNEVNDAPLDKEEDIMASLVEELKAIKIEEQAL